MTETVKVRIAVAVDDEGNWFAHGGVGSDDNTSVFRSLLSAREAGLATTRWRHSFLEADVPLPFGYETIPATVSPAEGE